MAPSITKLRFVFFGTPQFAEIILDELKDAGFRPSLIVTAPDKPKRRKLILTPSEVRVWGEKHGIPVFTPPSLRDDTVAEKLKSLDCNLFIVAAYGKIIPEKILAIPKQGTLNVHPSLLPKFRGSSPIESVILSDEHVTGVTIIELDKEMDHGPVVAQRERIRNVWPPKGSELTLDLAHFGGKLLAEIIPEWMNGLRSTEQDHSRATFTKKITKEDGLIDLAGDPVQNYRKIQAFDKWPGAYFFTLHNRKQIRVRITEAALDDGALTLLRVVPEGKNEMLYNDFLRGLKP